MKYVIRLFKRLMFATRLQDESIKRREPVLNILFATTFIVLALSLILLLASYSTGFTPVITNHIFAVVAALIVTVMFHISLRHGYYFFAAYGILSVYAILAIVMTMVWGINLPSTLLLYSILIVLSGMVLGARFSLYALLISMILLFGIEYATVTGHIHPNTTWRKASTHLVDLGVYYLAFIILGTCSWLFNRQTDAALHQALRAESALQREKEKLEAQVMERTRELQAMQLEKMEQLYRFAELGQFSTSLLHDLGNHMATLSVDLEGIAEHYKHTELQQRIKRRIHYIDNMVHWAYERIQGKVRAKNFNTKQEVQSVIKLLRYTARHAHVRLVCDVEGLPPKLYGDPNRFQQLIINLVSNAIDASEKMPNTTSREVGIAIAQTEDKTVVISVYNYGSAIPKAIQEKIFEPFYSTKHKGMGIGLFVVKQIVEEHFRGSIVLQSNKRETRFTLNLHGATARKNEN